MKPFFTLDLSQIRSRVEKESAALKSEIYITNVFMRQRSRCILGG